MFVLRNANKQLQNTCMFLWRIDKGIVQSHQINNILSELLQPFDCRKECAFIICRQPGRKIDVLAQNDLKYVDGP